jgi:hypothetical protein
MLLQTGTGLVGILQHASHKLQGAMGGETAGLKPNNSHATP